MPDIVVGAQILDIVFHPTYPTVYAGLLTGQVQAFAYDGRGNHKRVFNLRPSKRSCRGLAINDDGSHLYTVGKGKALFTIDTVAANVIETRAGAHEAPINRVKHLTSWLLATGDDNGVIKLWDPRQRECTRTYTQHFDYITDFLWLDDKKHLVATSGDGTLSVMDVRSKKNEPFAQSEDQEDELLSITAIKGASKIVVGTQIGILSIFSRSRGWGDCVDRVPGHPHSVDTLCALPPSIPDIDTASTILTGSSDGFVRAVQILPTKLSGVVADHGEWPVERIAIGGGVGVEDIQSETSDGEGGDTSKGRVGKGKKRIDRNLDKEGDDGDDNEGQGRWWVGSTGHDETLRLTNLTEFFEQQATRDTRRGESRERKSSREESAEHEVEADGESVGEASSDEDVGPPAPKEKKRKRRQEMSSLAVKKKGRNEVVADKAFFDEL